MVLNELKNEVNTFSEHLFNKDWQIAQLQSLRNNLPKDSCLCIVDFAENYKFFYQDEVQGLTGHKMLQQCIRLCATTIVKGVNPS